MESSSDKTKDVTDPTSSIGGSSEIPLDDITEQIEDNTKVVEEQKKIESHSLKKLISTMLTIVILIFGGAGAFYGIEGKNEERESETGDIETWKYLNCVYFCVVTLTTIGYGDMSPKTSGGRVFMVFYAIISLGVMAAAITSVGQVIVARANKQKDDIMKVSKLFTRKLKKLAKMEKIDQGNLEDQKEIKDSLTREIEAVRKKLATKLKWVIRLIGLLSLIAVTILVGAKGFSELEGWTYGESIYYCFVTLLTIGYGDFYPHTDGGKIFFIFYVFIGLGLIAFVVGDVGEKVLSNTQARLQEAKLEQSLKNNLVAISKLTKLPKFPLKGKKDGKDSSKQSPDVPRKVQEKAQEPEMEKDKEKELTIN